MSDFDLSDIEEMQVSLELEDGSTLECEVIYIFEWSNWANSLEYMFITLSVFWQSWKMSSYISLNIGNFRMRL